LYVVRPASPTTSTIRSSRGSGDVSRFAPSKTVKNIALSTPRSPRNDEVGVLGGVEDDGGRVAVANVVVHRVVGAQVRDLSAQVGGRNLDVILLGGALPVPGGGVW
jgi:hypothetical protein